MLLAKKMNSDCSSLQCALPQIRFIIIFTAADLPVLVSYLAPFLLAFHLFD
jgi:hypothetical protein